MRLLILATLLLATGLAAEPVKVVLAGDSTVASQPTPPKDRPTLAGWGQMLGEFMPGVTVVNHARSGTSTKSFRDIGLWDRVLKEKVLIQFGHNDQKEKGEGVGAFTSYSNRLRNYVKALRSKGANPILVTAVARRRFDADGKVVESLGDFPEAVRRVAAELKVPLVDLNASSKQLYQALGVEKSKLALLHVPANTYPGQKAAIADDTHFSAYGAYEMARCVAEGLRMAEPTLAAHLRPEVLRFDPAKPDDPASLGIPASAPRDFVKPDGK